ncbi:MAG: DUF5005 domain-containing protein [bacterium]|nr:DUF5005 domain-containing protein [bacterium]
MRHHHSLFITCLFVISISAGCVQTDVAKSEPALPTSRETTRETTLLPEFDAVFQRSDGWTGADGDYTVELGNNKVLWLFSDGWVGKVRDNVHVNSIMIHNSIAIQNGKTPAPENVEFYYGRTLDGKPDAFINPADGLGWYWIFHGGLAPSGLYLFLKQMVKTGDGAWGFQHAATWIGYIENPEEEPEDWSITQVRVPWDRSSDNGNFEFGSYVMEEEGYFYIYGVDEERTDGWLKRYLVVARVMKDSILDFDQWRFYHDGGWSGDYQQSERLCGEVGAEFSVSYDKATSQYVLLTTRNGLSDEIQIHTAPHPWGPWSEGRTVFHCPDAKQNKNYFTYAGKGHPALSRPGELVFSYVCNSSDFFEMARDASIYHPRFVRLRLGE